MITDIFLMLVIFLVGLIGGFSLGALAVRQQLKQLVINWHLICQAKGGPDPGLFILHFCDYILHGTLHNALTGSPEKCDEGGLRGIEQKDSGNGGRPDIDERSKEVVEDQVCE